MTMNCYVAESLIAERNGALEQAKAGGGRNCAALADCGQADRRAELVNWADDLAGTGLLPSRAIERR